MKVLKKNGNLVPFDANKTMETIKRCGENLNININFVYDEFHKSIYDEIKTDDIDKLLLLSSSPFIEFEPDYNFFVSRIFRQIILKEVFNISTQRNSYNQNIKYRDIFVENINFGVQNQIFDKRLLKFDLKYLSEKINIERDDLFKFIGTHTIYERYLAKVNGKRIETQQAFWMRVAMGLSINEKNKEERALEFYNLMSQFLYIPSTPTLFHSGYVKAQLSSCYLNCCNDDLKGIFKVFSDNAQMSKWSGGIGTDWSPVRSTGALINSTNVESQGVVPFLKISNDVTVAINRSGKRRGATCAYLETWHLDIEDFIDLKRNTGDERRRTHDMNTANWIPDLFMKRVKNKGKWTLFSPDEVPDLHEIYGKKFEERYHYYENMAELGLIKKFKIIEANKLWKKMIQSIFETGHPWLTWKDSFNVRSPQDHDGVIHNSNLCVEIGENNKPTIVKNRTENKYIQKLLSWFGLDKKTELGETAVCNLGSFNIIKFVDSNGKFDYNKLKNAIAVAVRMSDNVIDLNYYPVPEAKKSNINHRPIGLGVMGLQDALFEMNINFEDSLEFNDELMEFISFWAIDESANLAKERGTYKTFKNSKWDRGIFPLDTLDLLEVERGIPIDVNRNYRLPWQEIKTKVKKCGMRNSLLLAIAPTATISTIVGNLGPCIEPIYSNIFAESNITGEFTVINEYLIKDLKKNNLWNKEVLDLIKFNNGSVQNIDFVPENIKNKYKGVFEMDVFKIIDINAVRSKWIDQSQSFNIFYKGNSGSMLSDIYMYCFEKGLKSTYYLRTLGISQIEKSTLDNNKFGSTSKREAKTCKINDPACEACQ